MEVRGEERFEAALRLKEGVACLLGAALGAYRRVQGAVSAYVRGVVDGEGGRLLLEARALFSVGEAADACRTGQQRVGLGVRLVRGNRRTGPGSHPTGPRGVRLSGVSGYFPKEPYCFTRTPSVRSAALVSPPRSATAGKSIALPCKGVAGFRCLPGGVCTVAYAARGRGGVSA
ncbi:hypothetical protein GCM10010329_19060 [Streptomyces spiroverticillatus]|uniref:Uncharacterized protein n=1 Tax=Streptomyces finlayi TaxID=67296 RepID=A0A918WU17_9ACTN|nr:hypothetical protein GCM10010329_19060 [Streptomyces spiroverticillatus]GHC82902.1 hypothetical protein GCM10010334_11540 [Streptomyces finlayi]